MESFELFINKIIDKKKKEASLIISEAEKQASNIIAEAEEKAFKIVNEKVTAIILAYKREKEGAIKLEIIRKRFLLKDKIFESIEREVRKAIEDKIHGEKRDWYLSEVLYGLLKEACEKLGEVEVIVQANENDLEWFSKNKERIELRLSEDLGLPIKIEFDTDPIDVLGGVIVYSKSREKYYINTLESRLNVVLEKYRNITGKQIKEYLNRLIGGA